ncbi:beta-lactamase [Calothrix sp. NIES-4071]|nr:beta-lactamase [Calothrix sp. NIES-4071]BAZ54468.1 beta-lactamase [Calothrix sp. NIES-4105]
MKHLLVKLLVLITALLSLAFYNPAQIIHPQQEQQTSAVKKQDLNDLQGLKTFVDKYVAKNMDDEQVPGVAIVVVRDGKIYFQKGYGYADIENKKPVVASKTLFRVASISKLFTATAVMQLVEQGKINLNEDVHKYIKDFELDTKYSQPITVANLLTHTSGLDVNDVGMSARTQNLLQPLGKHLANHKPQQILPPGTITTYSNYGVALAGYIVEKVSGIPFAQYIDKNILQPLQMQHSSFLQAPPSALKSDLAIGYEYKNSKYQLQPYTYEHQVPAIALSTTATDIANFMIAHLNQGRYGNNQILQFDTIKQMQRQHFTNDPRIPGIAYVFQEQFRNDFRIIRHGGLIEGFVSQLALIPQDNVGIFIVCNSTSSFDTQFIKEFLNRYYPIQNKPDISRSVPLKLSNDFKGSYLDTITSQTTIEKVLEPYYFSVEVKSNNILVYDQKQYIQIEPMLFLSLEGDKYISFRKDSSNTIYLFDGIFTLRKISWYENLSFQIFLYKAFLSIFILVCIFQPATLTLGYFYNQLKLSHRYIPRRLFYNFTKKSKKTPTLKIINFLTIIIGYLNLLFIIVGKLILSYKMDNYFKVIYGINTIYITLLCLPIISCVITFILLFYIWLIWRGKEGTYIQRVYYTFITGAALLFMCFLNYWNLLGFKF